MDLDDLAREMGHGLGVVGAQIAVLHRDEVFEGCFGLANLETRTPVTRDTLFQVGSTAKMYTAVLVMQLVDEGLVDLDVPVLQQLPGFRLATDKATRTVTPRHLLTMSSGIDNGPYVDYGGGDDALTRYVEALADVPLLFAPGHGFGYSNASTNVSGRLIEHVTGKAWEAVLRERLLEPASLTQSATRTEDVITRRHALGHIGGREPSVLRNWSLPRSMGPSGSTLCQSAGDLVRFAGLFLGEGTALNGVRILFPDTADAMQTRQVDVPSTLLADWWGLGPYGKEWRGGTLVGHSGTTDAGSSYVMWSPDDGVAVATTVNCPRLGYPFAKRVFEELFGSLAGLRPPARPYAPRDVEVPIDRLVGVYEMSGLRLAVDAADEQLVLSLSGELDATSEPSRLIPLSPTTFLPTDPAVDGNRGWALAFVGAERGPATHLVNGFFCTRRVA